MTMRSVMTVTILGVVTTFAFSQRASRPHVCYVTIKGDFVLHPLADFLGRAIKKAKEEGAECLIVQISTPGGNAGAMQKIVEAFLNSPVPIVTYVAPKGASADSAGALITMAGHIAAMAPATRIGAAHPVIFSPTGEGPTGETAKILTKKATNAIAAAIKALAEERGRNKEWAEKMVREAIALTAREAVEKKVVDLIAKDIRDLLDKINGWEIKAAQGIVKLRTEGAFLHPIPKTAKEKFLGFLANPNVAYLLLLIAMLGFILEVYNPGAILPIVTAVIAFLLFLYSTMILPVNIVGILLILAAIAFFIAELFITSHGLLAGAGVFSLLLGGYLLFPTPAKIPEFYAASLRVDPIVLWGTGAFFAVLIVSALIAVIRGQRRRPEVGREWLVGKIGEARTDLSPIGTIFLEGSWWTAEAVDGNVKAGEKVEVMEVEGLRLKVRRKA